MIWLSETGVPLSLEPAPGPRKRRPWLPLVVLAGLGVAGGAVHPASLPPVALMTYNGSFHGGPRSTASNHGYASPNNIVAIPVKSYTAVVTPKAVGVQFLDASATELENQGLVMTATTPTGQQYQEPLTFTRSGFVGYAPTHPFTPGRWTFQLGSSYLGYTPTWTVTIAPKLKLSPPTANGLAALATLNAMRETLGLAPVTWSERLQLASLQHARYLGHYGYHRPSFHMEKPGPLYFAKAPWDRDLKAGWPDASTGEVGVAAPYAVAGPMFIAALTDTVYHRLGLLSPNVLAAGMARWKGSQVAASIMDMSFGYRSNLPLAEVYPVPGARGVATSWQDNEVPDPVPHGRGGVYGYPITADFPTVRNLGTVAAELAGPTGAVVPTYFDAPGQGGTQPDQLGLVPKVPLRPHTTYTVTIVSDSVRFNDGSLGNLAERWHFTTGGGSESPYLVPDGSHLLVVVDVPGQFGAGHPVPVSIVLTHGKLRIPLTATVGPSGVLTLPMPTLTPGQWSGVVTTNTENQGHVLFRVP